MATPPSDPFGACVGTPVLEPGTGPILAVKDNVDVQGLPTRAGLGGPGHLAQADAPIVARLRAAGWRILGKTRMDEAALGASGDNPHHGRTLNPAAPAHSPGGSSGGSASAVASHLADAAIGTDTLGSVRIPAAYCGLLGLKPSRNLLPMDGIVPLSPTLDHAGLLTRDLPTLATLLQTFTPQPTAKPPGRIGVPRLDPIQITPETKSAIATALARLQAAGWIVEPCTLPAWDPEPTRRAALLLIEAEGALIHAPLLDPANPAMSPQTRQMLTFGRDSGASRLVRSIQALRQAEAALLEALDRYDLLALPTVPAPAFPWSDPPPPHQAIFAALANWPGAPALSIPLPSPNLPLAIQLIARPGDDWRLLDATSDLLPAISPRLPAPQPQ